MSRSLNVFVDSKLSREDFIMEIESILGTQFERISNDYEIYYEFRNPPVCITAGEHELENDKELNFEDYCYDIEVQPINIWNPEERRKLQEDIGCLIFEKLKATRRYRLMLVDDLQFKLEEFHSEP